MVEKDVLGVSSALIIKSFAPQTASLLHSIESQTVHDWRGNDFRAVSFCHLTVSRAATSITAVHVTATSGNEIDHMTDHLVIHRHEVSPGMHDCS
jgi:hypothetical protein